MSDKQHNPREFHLRRMLMDAHRQLLHRDEQIIQSIRQNSAPADSVVNHLQRVIRDCVPADSRLVIVSKGDDALLALCENACHFPQDKTGAYAWHHPAGSAEAIAHLEELQSSSRGGDYLLIPAGSLWWLEYYADFHRYLQINHHAIWLDSQCALFRLVAKAPDQSPLPEYRHLEIQRPVIADRIEASLPFGVNLAGNFNSEKGTGEAVRSNLRSLLAAKVPLALNDVPDDSSANHVESAGHRFQNDNPYLVNLVHLNPDSVLDFVDERGERYFRGHYNIGYWVWELADFPTKWAGIFRFFDEIWVPSDFVLDAISRVSPVPVVKIPHSIREPVKLPAVDRTQFGISPSVFCFFFMFDFHSFVERKNPVALIEAFKLAFGHRTDVHLLLKCSRSTPDDLERLKTRSLGSNVRVFDQLLSRSELSALMIACDCYVSLHRSEGFGLTLAEAMSLGKPVIATGYSGNLEFMTGANSCPVDYRLIPLETDQGDYAKGSYWAEADIHHAAELMKRVCDQPELRMRVSQRAARDTYDRLAPAVVGRLISARLKHISNIVHPLPMSTVASRFIPPYVRVAVVTGADPRLLQLAQGQNAVHFPQRQNGRIPDRRPFTDDQLIAHLKIIQEMGTEYLVVPSAGRQFIDASPSFHRYLKRSTELVHEHRECQIFRLAASTDFDGFKSIPVPINPKSASGMRFFNGRWRSDGCDCHIILQLESPVFVSAVRVVYSSRPESEHSSHVMLSRVFWTHGELNGFDESRSASFKLRLAQSTQNRLAIVNELIDRIRFDPDLKPASLDKLEVYILTPDNQE